MPFPFYPPSCGAQARMFEQDRFFYSLVAGNPEMNILSNKKPVIHEVLITLSIGMCNFRYWGIAQQILACGENRKQGEMITKWMFIDYFIVKLLILMLKGQYMKEGIAVSHFLWTLEELS
jgi:hypothetical protein